MVSPMPPLTPGRILRGSSPVFHGLWSSGLQVVCGLWIAAPWTRTFQDTPAWNALAALAPEAVWGLVMFALGLLHLVALWYRWLHLRAISCFLSGGLWIIFAWVFFWNMNSGLGWILFAGVALGQWWCFARLQNLLHEPEGPSGES